MTKLLKARETTVRFGHHPVCRPTARAHERMLAEANVSYDIVLRWTKSTAIFPQTDVVMVIGAYDTGTHAAAESPWQPDPRHCGALRFGSTHGSDLKRGMARVMPGENRLFFKRQRLACLFGDAKTASTKLVGAIAGLEGVLVSGTFRQIGGPLADEKRTRPSFLKSLSSLACLFKNANRSASSCAD